MNIGKHLHPWSESGAIGGLWEEIGDVVQVFDGVREGVGQQAAEERAREEGVL